jgi:hypothetical protein
VLSEPSSSASLPRLLRRFLVFDCIVPAKLRPLVVRLPLVVALCVNESISLTWRHSRPTPSRYRRNATSIRRKTVLSSGVLRSVSGANRTGSCRNTQRKVTSRVPV